MGSKCYRKTTVTVGFSTADMTVRNLFLCFTKVIFAPSQINTGFVWLYYIPFYFPVYNILKEVEILSLIRSNALLSVISSYKFETTEPPVKASSHRTINELNSLSAR